ncbi:MAG: metallophosphoesterase, partial [Planctomycetota bacterium]
MKRVWATAMLATAGLGLHLVATVAVATYAMAEAAADQVDRGPMLQSLAPTRALVLVRSFELTRGEIRFGPRGDLDRTLESSSSHRHVFALTSLDPDVEYEYQVTLEADAGSPRSYPARRFRTPPAAGDEGELRVVVVGDTGVSPAQDAIIELIEELEAPILLHAGDLVHEPGTVESYDARFFSVWEAVLGQTSLYPVLGNHDCWASPDGFLDEVQLPTNSVTETEHYYSFDAGDAHFVALNSCDGLVDSTQLDWLERDLSSTERGWIIVWLHHPLYSNGVQSGSRALRTSLAPLFERYGVDLVFAGHDHAYERFLPIAGESLSDAYQSPEFVNPAGVTYIVSGGGGAELGRPRYAEDALLSAVYRPVHHVVELSIREHELEMRAIGLDGEEVDRLRIRKDTG